MGVLAWVACARTGAYHCIGNTMLCDAPSVSPTSEVCGDRTDNDCDGATDESDAIDAPTWYADCPFTPATAPPPNSADYDLNCDGNVELATPTLGGIYVIFDFGMPRQTVTFCGDASTTGCCITDFKGVASCCGCTLGVHVECVNYRGDTNAWYRCR